MGCHCAKDRGDESIDDSQQETLTRIEEKLHEERLVQASPLRSPLQRRKTVLLTASPIIDPIRRITRPIEALYSVDSVLKQWDNQTISDAVFLGTKQKCFLKTIEKPSGRNYMQMRVKLSGDIEKLNRLDHPSVLRTYEVMQDDKNFYLASEPYLGGQLADQLDSLKPKSEAFAAKVVHQVLGALCYCHRKGIVHGNVSLDTIVLLDSSDNPKARLTGFCDYDSVGPDSPQKPLFTAPEAAEKVTEKCDVWSCGIVLYKLITNQLPFPPDKVNGRTKRRRSTFPILNLNLEGKGKDVTALIMSMLDRNPETRPSALQCRNNPWLKQFTSAPILKTAAMNSHLTGLRKLRSRNPLQESVLKFILRRVLSSTELDCLTEAFFALDKDEDGILCEEELRQSFARVMPQADAAAATRRTLEVAEYNGSSVIGFSEFVISALGEKRLMSPANLRTVFGCFDSANSGRISLQELRNVFSAKISSERERQWRELLLQAGTMTEDKIDYGEFTALASNFNPNS